MSFDAGRDCRSESAQEQARYWERKLDLLLRLEAEALVERLGSDGRESHDPGTPREQLPVVRSK